MKDLKNPCLKCKIYKSKEGKKFFCLRCKKWIKFVKCVLKWTDKIVAFH
jgi:hypothetical protein